MGEVRDFLLPDLGEGLEEAEIVAWQVEIGDHVELNQDICEVETAKSVVAVPCPFSGTVIERFGLAGETLQVGAPLIRIDVEEVVPGAREASNAVNDRPTARSMAQAGREVAEEAGSESPPPKQAKISDHASVLVGYGAAEAESLRRRRSAGVDEPVREQDRPVAAPADRAGRAHPRPLAKPPVRKLAQDLGVDLGAIAPGSGPDGIVTRADVRAAAHAGTARTPATPTVDDSGLAPGSVVPLAGVRKRIAEKMARSHAEIPAASCGAWVDCTALWDLRDRLGQAAAAEGEQVKITPLALVLRATVLALSRFAILNARIDLEADEIRLHEKIHLGVATATPRGLLVPVIRHAESRSTLELARELHRLATAAREGSIGPEELVGSTFTVTNYGAFGNDDGTPIINHPEAAILGVGAMKQRPWSVDGQLALRRVAKFVCVFDHRVMDGAAAGGFLTYLGGLVEDPSRILLRA